jgi:hypothetical protein
MSVFLADSREDAEKRMVTSVSCKDKNKAGPKKRKPYTTVKKDWVNRFVKRSDPPIPAHQLSRPVLQRTPGKNPIKPVATTSMLNEHLGLHCYRGAL